ncbi:MAG TPA: URC4/urg3 family protein [Polyangiales bacterium]|nr:URC4/urg3 family protein [Polyangiales bacterium]
MKELRSGAAIRARCHNVLEAGLRDDLAHFVVHLDRLPAVAALTAQVTRKRYPSLQVPAHSRMAHFDAEGVQRVAKVMRELSDRDAKEQGRVLVDLVVTSVLLDAGAGMEWRYRTSEGLSIGRSEGLAIASLDWVCRGALSSRGREYEVDAGGLAAVDTYKLNAAFQVSRSNPLVGVEGRVHLLRALGEALQNRADVFGEQGRIGGLVDYLGGPELPAAKILETLLDSLQTIWPGRLNLEGVSLGDVWRHPNAGGSGLTAGLVPFHKLSQWLSFSLLHPLAVAGLRVTNLDALTGLAEYRNGGLFIDLGVLTPRDPSALARTHGAGDELVVEWRALTVALLDRVAPLVNRELGVELSLPAILEGGTWAAGREIARQLREDGGPPLRIDSDGTVF